MKRLKKSVLAQKIMVATTLEPKSEQIAAIANQAGVSFYHGSTEDVLDRFYKAVVDYQPDYVVRVTSDCPLIDASLIDAVIEMTITNQLDYGANVLVEHFPVTPYLRKNADVNGGTLFKTMNFAAPDNYNKVRMTVDEPSDLATVALLIAQLGTDKDWKTYTDYILAHQDALSNQSITRNEGYLKSLNQDTHE